jgi:catechol 2,3-dioxygenase-like lactoylglutathione lyase family enzyme
MIKLDHLAICVTDAERSRDWYVRHFGFTVEFEVPERHTVALQDEAGITLFLVGDPERARTPSCGLTFQVADVEATHRALAAAGLPFVSAPQKLFWGYGAELKDPDGYLIHLWDERSMREKGGA